LQDYCKDADAGASKKKSSEKSNVEVAVRVRPFNSREVRMGASRVVTMQGNTVTLGSKGGSAGSAKAGKGREFVFDHALDSFDPSDPLFVSQNEVFGKLGWTVLGNAWKGYNATLFAYGQTGAGKSFAMQGPDVDPGIIPRVCEHLFYFIQHRGEAGVSYAVDASFLEVVRLTDPESLTASDRPRVTHRAPLCSPRFVPRLASHRTPVSEIGVGQSSHRTSHLVVPRRLQTSPLTTHHSLPPPPPLLPSLPTSPTRTHPPAHPPTHSDLQRAHPGPLAAL
jgi:hypothetical protein